MPQACDGSVDLKLARNLASAFFAVFAPAAALADVAKGPAWLAIVFGAIAVLGALTALVYQVRITQADRAAEESQHIEEAEQVAERFTASLRTPGVERFGDVTAYELGVDHEQIPAQVLGLEGGQEYLERDRDDDLRSALDQAVRTGEPGLVVLRGLPKAGKSRMLFEVVRRDERLRAAWVLAPRDRQSLDGRLASAALDGVPEGPVVLWLDDLELFVGPPPGLHLDLRQRFARWGRPVVVLATAGGSGATHRTGDRELVVPI